MLFSGNDDISQEDLDEARGARYTAEQELDKIYHSIPEWVHRLFPNLSLSEKIAKGFEYQKKVWCDAYVSEVEKAKKMTDFSTYIVKEHGLDYFNSYWNFLIHKDLVTAKENEKPVLTTMKKPV